MKRKIVIAGGTGFIGKYFAEKFQSLGYEILIIARSASHIKWDDQPGIIAALENAELLINLAGKSVDCRYNEKNKTEILKSRVETTRALGMAILECKNPPKLWINSSTATIYRHAEDRPMTESNGEIGTGFSVKVATSWENEFLAFDLRNTRQVSLRIAIVLGKNGGVMTPFKNLVRFGLGGQQGNGRQMFSWIHVEDLFQIVLFIQRNDTLSGVFNCASPNPITNAVLMRSLRAAMGISFGLPSPSWLLNIGAVMIGTETELILKSRWVIPERLEEAGYEFKHPTIDEALMKILK